MPSVHASKAPHPLGASSMRVGVERGMTATLAVVAVLLFVLALPGFPADHRSVTSPVVATSLCLSVLLVAGVPLSILGREEPARPWLWTSVTAYGALLALEPHALVEPLPTGSTPWLLALSLLAFGCVALAETNPLRAGVVCAGLDGALAAAYAGRIPGGHSVIDAVGLGLLAAGIIAGASVLRSRADRADRAEMEAQRLFRDRHRQDALEAERITTDALVHDSVLATLLVASGHGTPDRATSMARSALDVISDAEGQPVVQSTTTSLGRALATAERDLLPLSAHCDFDMTAAADVELPTDVANALVAATLQAVTNSIQHAGPHVRRAARAVPADGGVRIVVSDDGRGFDPGTVDEARLGVRVSILEHVRSTGASAEVTSSPGAGTTIVMGWRAPGTEQPDGRRPRFLRVNLIPRRQLSRVLTSLVVIAILTAISEAALFSRAVGPLIAAGVGLAILPALLRATRTGAMRARTVWSITAGGLLLCCTATIGLDPTTVDCVSIYWYTCGVLAGAVIVWMSGHRLPPVIAVGFQIAQITLWAGPTGAIRLGLAAEVVLVIAGLMMHRAVRRISGAADVAADKQRVLTARQADLDAFHLERRERLRRVNTDAAPMLLDIIARNGELDSDQRAECRVLEQALRDDIRGRRLLNPALRSVVSEHRRSGTHVQVLDDGGLDEIPAALLDPLLDDAARQIQPLRSSRIVIRTGQPDSGTAITIVASTPDETAAALGIDGDDEVDLWVSIPRPSMAGLAA